ncbi:bile acid:sodium symporter family protein [Pinisolibacter sp.]|mgnify:FL=1|uniref:bile acid:sodium symporter family protein n=1 Tax=Pinisolibacter sp. TaxID=2172024 RepID=UPI002FDE4BE8
MTLIIPLGLAFLMLCVGLETRIADFRALAHAPLGVAAGLVSQIVGLPLIAIAVAHLLGLPAAHAVGVVLVAAAPGGVTANFVTLMAAGDVALCVTVTVLGSLAAPLTVPIVVGLAFHLFAGDSVALSLPLGPTIGAVFVTTVVPLVIGIAVAERHAEAVARARPILRRASFLVFLVIVVTAIASQWSALVTSWKVVGLADILLNLAAMAVAAALGKAVGVKAPGLVALSISGGLRNIALALTVAIGILGRPDIAVAATVHVFVMNASALALVAMRRRSRLVRDQGAST